MFQKLLKKIKLRDFLTWHKHMKKHSEEKVPIDVVLFDFEGNILAKKSEQ